MRAETFTQQYKGDSFIVGHFLSNEHTAFQHVIGHITSKITEMKCVTPTAAVAEVLLPLCAFSACVVGVILSKVQDHADLISW